jgi:flagellar operon protein
MNINTRPVTSIHQIAATVKAPERNKETEKSNFSAILNSKLNQIPDVKMSKHAAMRLETRNIKLNNSQMERLKKAVDKASAKGIKDTLVVLDKLAFVVNVNARTVITAVNQNELKDNVFTNIDGAVFT